MTTIKTWRERLEPLTTRTRAVNKAEVAMQAEIDELRIALERKDRLLNSMREDFRLIGKDYLGPEELSSCCDLCIEAITKELT